MTSIPSPGSHALRRVAVFCGSHHGQSPAYGEGARQLGTLLAERGLALVYGGGNVGLMGVIADAVLAHGGEAIGVIPKALQDLEVAHHGLTELHITETMHQRKRLMYDMADAVIAMPGGIGTLDELFESLTWNSLGYMAEPCGVLDIDGYYQPLLTMLDSMVEQGLRLR